MALQHKAQGHFKQQNHQQNTQKNATTKHTHLTSKSGTGETMARALTDSMKAETRRQSVTSVDLCEGHLHQVTQVLHKCP